MKNLHLIQTDKPSRLFDDGMQLYLGELEDRKGHPVTSYNIYITSDEEIKEGDWFMSDFNSFPLHNIKELSEREGTLGWKQEDLKNNLKIILTTDVDLIKDGVQAINDEFLEWFEKNPSCNEVEVKTQHQYHSSKEFYIDADYVNCSEEQYESIKEEIPTCPLRILYKIIIPKKEPKQETPKTFKELFANTGIKPTTDANGIVNYNFKATSKEPKYQLVGECKGNDGNGCFMDNCGHNCGCFDKELIDYSKNKNIEVKYTEDEVRRIAYNAYNYGQLDDPSEGKFNKFFSESKKTL